MATAAFGLLIVGDAPGRGFADPAAASLRALAPLLRPSGQALASVTRFRRREIVRLFKTAGLRVGAVRAIGGKAGFLGLGPQAAGADRRRSPSARAPKAVADTVTACNPLAAARKLRRRPLACAYRRIDGIDDVWCEDQRPLGDTERNSGRDGGELGLILSKASWSVEVGVSRPAMY